MKIIFEFRSASIHYSPVGFMYEYGVYKCRLLLRRQWRVVKYARTVVPPPTTTTTTWFSVYKTYVPKNGGGGKANEKKDPWEPLIQQ